jgi:hypothetical protein
MLLAVSGVLGVPETALGVVDVGAGLALVLPEGDGALLLALVNPIWEVAGGLLLTPLDVAGAPSIPACVRSEPQALRPENPIWALKMRTLNGQWGKRDLT